VNLDHTEQLEVSSFPKQMNEASEMQLQSTPLAEALAELYRLLEAMLRRGTHGITMKEWSPRGDQ
jgi:hypothetical protein